MSVTDLDRELLQLNQGKEGLPLTGVYFDHLRAVKLSQANTCQISAQGLLLTGWQRQ